LLGRKSFRGVLEKKCANGEFLLYKNCIRAAAAAERQQVEKFEAEPAEKTIFRQKETYRKTYKKVPEKDLQKASVKTYKKYR
jgi:hypothetical protein